MYTKCNCDEVLLTFNYCSIIMLYKYLQVSFFFLFELDLDLELDFRQLYFYFCTRHTLLSVLAEKGVAVLYT